jgi:hypothetical protein
MNNINSYDYDTAHVEEKLMNVETYQSLDDKWIANSHPENDTVFFYNILDGKSVDLGVEPSSRITFYFRLSPDEKQVHGTVFVDRKQVSSRKFVLFNLESKTITLMNIPGQKPELAEIQGWVNNDEFIATIYSEDGRISKSMVFNSKKESRN